MPGNTGFFCSAGHSVISNYNWETINGHPTKASPKLQFRDAGGRRKEETYLYAHIGVFVDRRWEKQEIPGFTSLLELGIQLGYGLLGGKSLDGFGRGHDPLSE